MSQNHDPAINQILARSDRRSYGMGLGVILLDDVYPAFPGDVRNPSGYPFPIQYEIARNVDIRKLVVAEDKAACLDPLLIAAKNLEKMGCRAIVGECGYFAFFQREVAASVNVPVFMSSLIQAPLVQQIIGPKKVVGLLFANSKYIKDRHLTSVGIPLGSNYVIGGAMDDQRCPEFDHLWTNGLRTEPPSAIYSKAESEFLEVAVEFYHQHSNMGAMLLECTGFPPFARALQKVIEIPILSWGTLLDYAYSIIVHRDYYGHV